MSSDNVVHFPGKMPPLDGANWEDMDQLIIIARKKDGTAYFASTTNDVAFMNYLADMFKLELLDG